MIIVLYAYSATLVSVDIPTSIKKSYIKRLNLDPIIVLIKWLLGGNLALQHKVHGTVLRHGRLETGDVASSSRYKTTLEQRTV